MFSHAFEEVGKKLNLKMAEHEHVSGLLIRDSEVSEALNELGGGFAGDVADVILQGKTGNLYDAVVSSQFDADRLDYLQRDRLMTGVQNSGIDFEWLTANLEVGTVRYGVDDQDLGEVDTFVLGPKAHYAAETFVLALFQLYPTVYFHKATRAAEKVFTSLMLRLVTLVRDGHDDKTGLPPTHPLLRFSKNPDVLENVLNLDDAVFWGALPMLSEACDEWIAACAQRLRDRCLPKAVDVRQKLLDALAVPRKHTEEDGKAYRRQLDAMELSIRAELDEWSEKHSLGERRILFDRASRAPYRTVQESKGPLNQIHIRTISGGILDVTDSSPVVAAINTFDLFRVYVDEEDREARSEIDRVVDAAVKQYRGTD